MMIWFPCRVAPPPPSRVSPVPVAKVCVLFFVLRSFRPMLGRTGILVHCETRAVHFRIATLLSFNRRTGRCPRSPPTCSYKMYTVPVPVVVAFHCCAGGGAPCSASVENWKAHSAGCTQESSAFTDSWFFPCMFVVSLADDLSHSRAPAALRV